ncbi:MAG: hypothetical protein SOZ59_14615 [Candidatus Limivivens sp.]|nr:hypothetical protein [Candidatus Limivivens sp.]
MSTFWNVLLIILLVVVVVLAILYFVGRKLQKKQAIQQEQMEAAKQTVTMLVIDKKKMKLKDSGLPSVVIEQTPKMMRRTKLPIVKAKVGPRIMTLVCDARIYDVIPLKKTVKAVVSGIYITEVKGIRGPLEAPPQKKKGFFSRFRKNKDEKKKDEKKAAK